MLAPLAVLAVTLGAEPGPAREPRVRLCITALPVYEQHTILHHIAYHRMIGIDEIFVYLDDRPDRNENETLVSSLATALERVAGVSVYLFTKTQFQRESIGNQFQGAPRARTRRVGWRAQAAMRSRAAAVWHCKEHGHEERAHQGYPRDLWVTNFDGDEYLAPATPLLFEQPSAPAKPFDVKAWLKDLPLDAVWLPRRSLVNGGDLTGELLQHAPTALLGDRFFEPRVYTRLDNSKSSVRNTCLGKAKPKWIGRVAPMDLAQTVSASIRTPPRMGRGACRPRLATW